MDQKNIENEVFTKNLATKADKDLIAFQKELAIAVKKIAEKYGLNSREHFSIRYSCYHSAYVGVEPNVQFVDEDLKKIKQHFSTMAMEKFQEALNNFAWAVQNAQQ